MEMISGALKCDRLKRYWRRRRYQKLYDETKGRKKIKIVRLGGKKDIIRSKQKLLQLKLFSPLKALVNVHDAYVDMMVKLVTNIGKLNNKQVLFGGKNKVAKTKQIRLVSFGDHHQVVDTKLVLQIYKRLAASNQF